MICVYAESFCWKNVSSFAVQTAHIFSAKNIRILCIESAKTVNEMTLNKLVKLTMLWTTGYRLIFSLFHHKITCSWSEKFLRRSIFVVILCYFFLFLLKNVICWYSVKVPRWGSSNENPQHMFSLTKIIAKLSQTSLSSLTVKLFRKSSWW